MDLEKQAVAAGIESDVFWDLILSSTIEQAFAGMERVSGNSEDKDVSRHSASPGGGP